MKQNIKKNKWEIHNGVGNPGIDKIKIIFFSTNEILSEIGNKLALVMKTVMEKTNRREYAVVNKKSSHMMISGRIKENYIMRICNLENEKTKATPIKKTNLFSR